MNVEELVYLFRDIENNYKVEEWRIDDVPLWPLIRLENYYLMSLSILSNNDEKIFRQWDYIKHMFISQYRHIKVLLKEPKISSKSLTDIVFLSDGVSFTKINDKWFEKFCDPLINELQKKGYTSQRWDLSYSYYAPRYTHSKFIQLQVDLNILTSKLITRIKSQKYNEEVWLDFENFINDETIKKYLKKIPTKNDLRRRVAKLQNLKKYYMSLLKNAKPSVAYIVSYYGDQQMAFILACKELGIATVDLQHGVQGEFHLAYTNWNKVPYKGYNCIPDYFFVWSNNESQSIISSCNEVFLKHHQPIVKGNLFADFWLNGENSIVKKYDRKIQKFKQDNEKPIVLLTLSPHTENMMEQTWITVKETQEDFNWWIRLHPVMLNNKKDIEKLLRMRGIFHYNLQEATDFPLYAILRNSNYHVTVQSTVVIEASLFGVPNVVTSEYGWELFKEQVVNLSYCLNSDSLKSKLNENIHNNNK